MTVTELTSPQVLAAVIGAACSILSVAAATITFITTRRTAQAVRTLDRNISNNTLRLAEFHRDEAEIVSALESIPIDGFASAGLPTFRGYCDVLLHALGRLGPVSTTTSTLLSRDDFELPLDYQRWRSEVSLHCAEQRQRARALIVETLNDTE
jgi:hypothetical protein